MNAEMMFRLRNDLRADGILFCYSGYMTEDVLTSIGKAIKDKLIIEEADKSVIRTVFAMFVEQVQNVIRYSEELESKQLDDSVLELRYGLLSVGRRRWNGNDSRFFVAVGNMIKASDVDRLRDNLIHIKNLDNDSLKMLYMQKLKGAAPKGSKGAGLGFIDIARKSKGDFDFDFLPINDKNSFFTLTAYA